MNRSRLVLSTLLSTALATGLSTVLLTMTMVGACKRSAPRNEPEMPTLEVGFLKGQTHVHTGNSGDSNTPAAEVVRFYEQRGFDFIVITDHNVITRDTPSETLLVFEGVELTQNFRDCLPAPPAGGACLLHINGLFVDDTGGDVVRFPAPTDIDRLAIYQRAIDETRRRSGIAQLNHPNMGWATDADGLVSLADRGVVLVEIANQNERESNRGDDSHPSLEAMWDAALSRGARVWGVATDDAHHYSDAVAMRAAGREAFVGDLGWIMVRAERDEASIRQALVRGDFYSSTGVTLRALSVGDGAISLEIVDDGSGPFTTTFIGAGGRVLATVSGTRASFGLPPGARGHVRARVSSAGGDDAWTQPSFRR